MPFFFRKLDGSLLTWSKERGDHDSWLDPDDVRADALKSLRTDDNCLSVYRVESQGQVDRVISAVASTRSNVKPVTYALVDASTIAEMGLTISETLGEVADPEVAKWHRDLTRLSGQRLLDLARMIQRVAQIKRKLDQPVGRLINGAIRDGVLDVTRLDDSLKEDLKKAKYRVGDPGRQQELV